MRVWLERLEVVIGSVNNPQKDVWQARIFLLSAAEVGTMAIQRQTDKGKPTIWRCRRASWPKGLTACCMRRRAAIIEEVRRGKQALNDFSVTR